MVTTSCVCIHNDNQVLGEIFTISIDPEDTVHQVKERIKQILAPGLDHIPSVNLSLWKLSAPVQLEENTLKTIKSIEFSVSEDAEGQAGVRLLYPAYKLSWYWPDINNISQGHLHLVATIPSVDPFQSTITLKRKREDERSDYLVEHTNPLYRLFKALWGRESDDSIREIKSEVVPDVNGAGASPGATSSSTTYNLSKAVGADLHPLCDHFLVREEYINLYDYVASKKDPKNFLLLGQPGIGKTIYLTYHLVKRLLAGQPTIIAFTKNDRFLFHESGVYDIPRDLIRALWKISPELNQGRPLVLVDFNANQTQSELGVFSKNPILAASSPNRARYKSWVKESNAEPYVMKTWRWDEIFHGRNFISTEYGEELQECFLRYGGCARLLFQKTPAAIDSEIALAIKKCRDIIDIIGIQEAIPEDGSSALIKVEPIVRADGSIDRMFMYCEVISQHVFEQLVQAQQTVAAQSFKKIYDVFRGQTPTGYVFEMHGHTILRRLLSQELKTRLLGSTNVKKFNIPCTGSGYFDPSNIGKFSLGIYYTPLTSTLPGVDSFISYEDPSSREIRFVFFQFTVSRKHPINPKFLEMLWKLRNTNTAKWSLVFVVPKTIAGNYAKQPWTPAANEKVWDPRVTQYVLGIDPDLFWVNDKA